MNLFEQPDITAENAAEDEEFENEPEPSLSEVFEAVKEAGEKLFRQGEIANARLEELAQLVRNTEKRSTVKDYILRDHYEAQKKYVSRLELEYKNHLDYQTTIEAQVLKQKLADLQAEATRVGVPHTIVYGTPSRDLPVTPPIV